LQATQQFIVETPVITRALFFVFPQDLHEILAENDVAAEVATDVDVITAEVAAVWEFQSNNNSNNKNIKQKNDVNVPCAADAAPADASCANFSALANI